MANQDPMAAAPPKRYFQSLNSGGLANPPLPARLSTSAHQRPQNATFTPTVKFRPISGAAVLMNEVCAYAKRSVRLLPLM